MLKRGIMENANIALTVVNHVKTADIWIIPDTDKNRKTTVWGNATISKLDGDTSKKVYIPGSVDTHELYLIRMIDKDQMFYSVDGVWLKNNQSIGIRENCESMSAFIDVFDEEGTKISEYEMFVARL